MAIRFVCSCGKALTVGEQYAGKTGTCPNCKRTLTVPAIEPALNTVRDAPIPGEPTTAARSVVRPVSQPAAPSASPNLMRANKRVAGKSCPICKVPLVLGDDVRICLQCEQVYHLPCWDANGGCATYGCEASPAHANAAAAATHAPVTADRGRPWFYESSGRRVGPVSEAEITELLRNGRIAYGAVVWQEGLPDWVPVENTPLKQHLSAPPPLTGRSVSNAIVWILAFAPLIGLFLEGFLAGATDSQIGNFWWVTLALNIALSMADEKKLKKAGHDTSKMGGAWLIPVYLYKRASILKQNHAYFIVWLVCFAIVIFGNG